MIDTDKYEGHDNWDGTKINMNNEANVQLIADAPLLLEEVKRLRAWKKLVSDIVQQQDGSHLREMLKELIE